MAFPNPIFTSNDLTDVAVWTEIGSSFANAVDDDCGTDTAIDHDGVDDGEEVTAGAVVPNSTAALSLKIQFNIPSIATNDCFMTQYTDGTNRTFLLRMEGSGTIAMYIVDSSNTLLIRDTTNAYHNTGLRDLLVTFDGTTILMYIDGVAVAMEAATGSFNGTLGVGTAPPLRVGVRGDGADPADGILARPRVWLTDLDSDQAADEYISSQACDISGGSAPEGIFRAFTRKLTRFVPRGLIR